MHRIFYVCFMIWVDVDWALSRKSRNTKILATHGNIFHETLSDLATNFVDKIVRPKKEERTEGLFLEIFFFFFLKCLDYGNHC